MNNPKLRFKGYTEDWEQRKLGEVAERVQGNDGRMDLPTLTISAANGWLDQRDRFSSNIAGSEQKNYTLLHKGELSYNHGNSKLAKYGTVFALRTYEEALVPRVYHSFRVTEDAIADFIEYVFATKLPDRELGKLISSGARMDGLLNINYDEFMSINITLPSIEEQLRISEYLRQVDTLITLHQRKCEQAEKLKKYMLQKMFPKNGESVPEIRFSGFTDAWEQRKLGEVTTSYSGGTPTVGVKEYYDGQIPFIRSAEINSESTELFISEKGLNSSSARLVSKGDILYALYGATSGEVGRARLEGAINQAILAIKPMDNYDAEYLTQWLRKSKQNIVETYLQGGQGNLSGTIVKELIVDFPTYDEQQIIGQYFSNLDRLITLHQCKCDKNKEKWFFDWEQRKLGEIAENVIGGGTPKTSVDEYWGGNIPWIQSANVQEDQLFDIEILKSITQKGLEKSAAKLVPANSIAVVTHVGVGKLVYMPFPYTTSQDFTSLSDLKTDELFTCYSIYRRLQNDLHIVQGSAIKGITKDDLLTKEIMIPCMDEQKKIGVYFRNLDCLITLHQCKCEKYQFKHLNDWEQRKVGDLLQERNEQAPMSEDYPLMAFIANQGVAPKGERYDRSALVNDEAGKKYKRTEFGDFIYSSNNLETGSIGLNKYGNACISPVYSIFKPTGKAELDFLGRRFLRKDFINEMVKWRQGVVYGQWKIHEDDFLKIQIAVPGMAEQKKIGECFNYLDCLITLHQRKQNGMKNASKYIEILIFTVKETIIMPELEAIIEQKLIDQLVYGDSQWTYRADLKTEEDLWANFKYILEQNNKDRLNGENLSDSEFEQVKNQLQFSSFYKAGEWLVGENGKVMVHVQRDTERLHLVVMNHEHIAGGSSVYEVINQYSALRTDENSNAPARDRRFDVTLMINGLPMIHIELKNKQHSYMDGFWQIKKYIGEGKFTGIFSAVQMFVISNSVNTKYFSAASDTELNPKFISGWLDKDNNPVADYLDFAKSVLRIPEAHEMIARYTVLDEDAKRLILLRPYQIHAIESIREASKCGKSGFVWHTTGSGKTLTSYKATRNLLMDIPAIDKAIFLIDRKDLDTQTTMAFQAYANNDLIDVDETDNVNDLKRKLKSDDRQVIVTTIQKLQRLITKRLTEGTPEYSKIKNLKIAFVVDECHRAVTPSTKRELERFFGNSLWFGFTGTPRFAENPYPQMGDLPRTTEELYGERLHKYTIQNAIHDNAVLGFQVEHNGPKNIVDETDTSAYDNETHMLKVLDVVLNKSYHKLGFQNGKGKTYEALLTTSSIQMAQKYYDLLTKVKNGETSLVIDEKIKQVLPDFPKFAITYSVSENEEGSHVNQHKMQQSLDEYNDMFGTKYEISQIQGYNGNLNKRLARKDAKFQSRHEQLDLVIVVDRLLTGFDAPCMSTIFIDRQPMGPHDLIQAFSRTNRIFDKNKTYGQIVTFQAPKLFKECVDNAVKLYSAGGTKDALMADWDEIEPAFRKALMALRVSAETPSEVPGMSLEEKKVFAKMFQSFDKLFAQLKSFTNYEDSMLEAYGITEDEYYDYAGHYLNVLEEIKPGDKDPADPQDTNDVDPDYELMAYSNTKIDYEYIINLIQNIVTPDDEEESITPEERQKKIEEVKQYVEELRKENPKVADIMSSLIYEIELDENKYKGQSILNIVETMKNDCIDKVITDFCITWYASKDDVMYAATHYRNGEIPNESAIKATIDFTSYKAAQERALPKFKYYAQMMAELRKTLEEEIKPLISH